MQNPLAKFRCPCQSCTVTSDLHSLYLRIMQPDENGKARQKTFETDTLEKLTVQYYLTHADDVRKCPKKDCKYSGFLTEGYCSEQLQCKQCKTRWSDPANFSGFQKFKRELKGLLTFNSQHFTYLRNLLFEEPCPRCGVMISKNGGCEHMVCGRCKYEFCWLCLGPYFRYQHTDYRLACPYRYFAVVGVMISLLLILFAKMGYAWQAVGTVVFPLYFYLAAGILVDCACFFFAVVISEFFVR